jgi:peptidyl-prolyl cis-trans isomerase SurA
MKSKMTVGVFPLLLFGSILFVPQPSSAQEKSTVVEEIVARVNNSIITRTDFEKSAAQLRHEIAQDCQKCPQAKLDSLYQEHEKDLLRDLIDQQLLIERGKDMSINIDADVIKRLDEVRKENNLATMDDLEKAVSSQGITWEDYKNQISNGLLTQKVIQQEVGSRLDIGQDEVKQYYDAHKNEFNRPEQVDLGEIFLGTDGKSPEEIAAIHLKTEDLHNRLVKGENFDELAKRYSEGSTAKDGGGLGTFERGQLSPQLEEQVFKLQKGEVTDVIQTKTGFEVLKVLNHYDAGLQPLDKVSSEITNKLYGEKMQPSLRDYLAELREESYVMVKPGYTDSAAVAGATVIEEVAPTPDGAQKKKKKLGVPKASGS